MNERSIPAGGVRYWVLLCIASILGCNTGDAFASVFGFINGLPILAVLFAAVILIERAVPRRTQLLYWTVIVIVRTAATNLADFSAHGVGTVPAIALLAGAMVLGVGLRVASIGGLRSAGARRSELSRVSLAYWGLMLLAGTLGTVIGDWASFRSGMGLGGASIVLSIAVAVVVMVATRRDWTSPLFYWSTIVLVRAAGTSVGDWFAKHIGLAASTVVFAVLLVVAIVAWRDASRPAMASSD